MHITQQQNTSMNTSNTPTNTTISTKNSSTSTKSITGKFFSEFKVSLATLNFPPKMKNF